MQNSEMYFACLARMVSLQRQRVKDLLLQVRVVFRTFTSSLGRLRQKLLHQKECPTCSTIIFPYSTNHIIDLWCCGCRRNLHSRACNRRYRKLVSCDRIPVNCYRKVRYAGVADYFLLSC